MANIILNTRQQQKMDTAANWATNNPILLAGELGFESDTGKFKTGNGTTAWNLLPYSSSGITPNNISNRNILYNGDFKFNSSGTDVYGDLTDTTTATHDVVETATDWFFERDYNGTFTVSTKRLAVGYAGSYARLYGNTNLKAIDYETKKFTLTVNVNPNSGNILYCGIGYGDASINNSYTNIAEISTINDGEISVTATIPSSMISTDIIKVRLSRNAGAVVINWVKLEIGENSTTYLPNESNEKISLIYDMRSEDPNINRGWTSGMVCGKVIRTDYNQYTSLRIYASINGCEVQKVIKIANRKKSDFSVYAINSGFTQICYLRFTFPVANAAFQVGQYAIYTFDLVNNTFSTLKGSINNDVYVYRVEGIY